MPALRPTPPIPLDPATTPLLNDGARKLLPEHYMKSERTRALVLGRNHFDWWLPGDNEAEAIRRNLQICGHMTGRPCVIYAINNNAIVRTPQSMRAVDIFVPQDVANVDDSQREALQRYLIANDWRAIAVARNGRVGIAAGRPSEQDAVNEAIRDCARAGGTECAVSAIGPFLVASK